MKTSKYSNLIRSVALFLVAIAIIGTIGFAANGWQSVTDPEDNSGDVGNKNDDADENKNDDNDEKLPQEPEIYVPKYVSYLTGLEVTEAEFFSKPICFAMNSKNPIYGISSAETVIEIPTENGDARLLTYINPKNLPGKIGSLSPTRKYIDNIIKYFGGIMVAYGNDDTVNYTGLDIIGSQFNLTEKTGYHYTEYTHYVYTNGDLVTAGIVNSGISSYNGAKENMPYNFTEFGAEKVSGTSPAGKITLPIAQGNESELLYSKTSTKYTLSKSGEVKKDLLNDKALEYDNVFVLFANATTYETAEASEMVLDTVSGGNGKYFTMGTAIDITWSTDASGNLLFSTTDGEKLIVNRGTSYIGFMKSSKISELVIQ